MLAGCFNTRKMRRGFFSFFAFLREPSCDFVDHTLERGGRNPGGGGYVKGAELFFGGKDDANQKVVAADGGW